MGRLERERDFHDKWMEKTGGGKKAPAYSIIDCSKAKYLELIVGDGLEGKRVLELGTGSGAYCVPLAERGARVEAIDISQGAIDVARERIAGNAVAGAIGLQVMNAEELTFPDGHFDVVCGAGIIHHLDLDKIGQGLRRVLKPGGRAVFMEPLGHNLLINLFRALTPGRRTSDEHPLLLKDLEEFSRIIGPGEFHFMHLAGLAAIPFASMPFAPGLRRTLDAMDGVLLKLPFLRQQAWIVVAKFTR